MPDIRVAAIVKQTGFGARYWQRRIIAGEVPAVRYLDHGGRRTYLIDAEKFAKWWEMQLCPVTSNGVVKSGGTGSPRAVLGLKARFKQTTLESQKAVLKKYAKT